jgi:cyclopropane fatty-acyl-phospholipid synthase-like methyltransferase
MSGPKNKNTKPTNWDAYYQHPYPTATFSRAVTGKLLVRCIQRFTEPTHRDVILELGGGNSCFLDFIQKRIAPKEYHIVDNNQLSLDFVRNKVGYSERVFLHKQDVRDFKLSLQADIIFSVGLIEHFTSVDLEGVIAAHFQPLRPGGIAIFAFPTPTWLYRIARHISESLDMWIFWDEIPLHQKQVIPFMRQHGNLLHSQINWFAVFTQAVLIVRKTS